MAMDGDCKSLVVGRSYRTGWMRSLTADTVAVYPAYL